jgi:hypothetical protein
MARWSANRDEAEQIAARLSEAVLAGANPAIVRLQDGRAISGAIYKIEAQNDPGCDRTRGTVVLETRDTQLRIDALDIQSVTRATVESARLALAS